MRRAAPGSIKAIGELRQRVSAFCTMTTTTTTTTTTVATATVAAALKTEELDFAEKPLFVPDLEELQDVIRSALSQNFETVSVDVLEKCPDLREAPYNLVGSGLGGSPLLLEIGGPPYLLPLVQRSKLYNLKDIARRCMGKGCKILALGAGAGPFPLRNSNCEGIFNMAIGADDELKNESYTAKVTGLNEDCILQRIPEDEPRCALLANLFICRGEAGRVLSIKCKKRTGPLNFIESMRLGLAEKFQEKCVGLGGVFLIKRGKVHQHVMRDFSTTPICTEEQLNTWLKFYEMPAQLNAVGTLITHENDLDLRLQHFHSFSGSKWGGHYHYDTTPDIVEYEAVFNVAERVVRVDRPKDTHHMGRD